MQERKRYLDRCNFSCSCSHQYTGFFERHPIYIGNSLSIQRNVPFRSDAVKRKAFFFKIVQLVLCRKPFGKRCKQVPVHFVLSGLLLRPYGYRKEDRKEKNEALHSRNLDPKDTKEMIPKNEA